jgi:flagellar hook-associated protein 2
MAVSSATSTSNIDVAAIVEQLMTVENRPLDVLKAKITQQNTVISDLGVIKGKVSTFQEALRAFQDPTTFNSASASSTDTSVVGVLASNGAIKGSYSVVVDDVALASKATVSGYTLATDLAGVDADAGFAITIGTTTYNTKGTPAGTAVIGANPTIADLKNWINALSEDVSANVVQTTANQYSLMIQGTKTGIDNAVTFTGLASPGTISTIAAQDASFSIDGIAFTRSTNSVSDVLNGVTLNLVKASDTAQTISITKGVDVSSAAINTLIKAYNELMSSYKEMTANSSNSSKPGTFANSPTALSFINQIKASFAKGISYTEGGTLKTMSLSTLGIDLQLDGTAKFNSANYATASANGLQDVLALGVAAGYIDSSNNLNTFLTAQVKTGGLLDLQIQSQNDSVRNMTKRQDDLQTRLNSVQNNLISQYSALNALLFQLNNTSTALTSALDALTNSQSNN